MADFPFMTTKTADLLADTTHLSATEFGGYWRLIVAMWRNGGFLPADDATLRKYSTLDGRSWTRSRETILRFFEVHDEGIITQKTVTAEYDRAAVRSGKASESAFVRWDRVKGNAEKVSRHSTVTHTRERAQERAHKQPKPLKTQDKGDAKRGGDAMRSQCSGDATYKGYLKEDDDGARTRASDPDDIPFDEVDQGQVMLDLIGQAAGVRPEAEGNAAGIIERWKKLDLDDDEILDVIRTVRSKKKGDAPERLAYFTKAMHDAARSKKQPILKSVDGGKTDDRPEGRKSARQRAAEDDLADDLDFAADLDRKRKGVD
jgi:uncharacterized protein YdaU (DUF1376 family)